MARSARAPIETRTRRLKLSAQKEPHWFTIERGLSVGYYRPAGVGLALGGACARDAEAIRYRQAALAHADDHAEADGEQILNWKQAQAMARSWAGKQTACGPADSCEGYQSVHRGP